MVRTQNPPTPAFAKAGAAPGTTAGVELVFLSNRHPKATSMASYGRPAQAIATRRPDPSHLLGGPACVRQAFAANRHPKATSMASYGRPSFFWAVQRAVRQAFAANRHPKRPHQWLLMGVQACRLPAPKPLKPSKPLKPCKPLKPSKPLKPFLWASSAGSQQASQGHINGFLWASKLAVCQPLNP